MAGERADQERPSTITPLAIRGEQGFEIVQDQQQARVAEDGGEVGRNFSRRSRVTISSTIATP
jgi:hypothetical protein